MKWIPWNVQTTDALFNPSDGMSISLLTFKHYMRLWDIITKEIWMHASVYQIGTLLPEFPNTT